MTQTSSARTGRVTHLPDLLEVTEVSPDGYVAERTLGGEAGMYGGQVVAQGMMAAAATVADDRTAHSLHATFLRPGDPRRPVSFEVHRDRDGRSYSARRVLARQDGDLMASMTVSFHVAEEGVDLQAVSLPDTPGPDDSEPVETHLVGIEVRVPDPQPDKHHPTRVWLRCTEPIGSDANLHVAALIYASDLFSGITDVVQIAPDARMTSLDHSLWIHRPVRLDDWVLMDMIGVSVASSRGWYTGHVYDGDGAAVAGMAQEMVLRQGLQG